MAHGREMVSCLRQTSRAVRLGVTARLVGASVQLGAASMLCGNSRTGWSVWCHTNFGVYQVCRVIDENGDVIRVFVDGAEQCRIWSQEQDEVAAW